MADISTIKSVRVDALVALRIVKHATGVYPTTVYGALLGMEVNGVLQITNTFPFPTSSEGDDSSSSALTPKNKGVMWYQNEMIKCLREVNIDANNVGWYQSTTLGNFINANFVENQMHYQSQMNERTVVLVYDSMRSAQGGLAIRAYRLTSQFITAYRENKFTLDALAKHNLAYKDILHELPLTLYNSHLATSLLHQLSTPPQPPSILPLSAAGLLNPPTSPNPIFPVNTNFNALDLTVDPILEKSCDLLLESIDAHNTEANNFAYYQRALAREQAKIATWQQKRKTENSVRVAQKLAPLPEDEWTKLFKLPQEPSRLDGLLVSRQIKQYARQVDGFTATSSAKLFALNGGTPRF
ncbi:eukaryotic translation initiation factor 3 subunit H [Drechslerella stenobrocha 248]|uniref:Eukaryotic translation initiation factor 3 subunit H n=1 Tax=Drechslerella stenobrocha 248 TaxID=1043628 RepID=W7HW92_9PEZI|nr:eukaryotic translation initiation factor 3 subunit H [Drechslerella stenobrocha 248]